MLFSERPPVALAEYTGFLLNWVALRSRRHFAERLEERFGIHPREFGALTVIARSPGLTQHALSEAAGIHPSVMVATIDALEERGLVERRPHAEDRRKRALHVTAHGSKILREATKVAARTGEEVFGALTGDERAQLNRLLRKLAGLEE